MTTAAEPAATPPSLAKAEWLQRADTQAVFRAMTSAGYSARVVGGAVRNALFGKPVKDIDFATTAQPDEVMAVAVAAGLKAVPTGIDHGTVTVIAGHAPFEVTTLREDVETFGRHAHVAFTQDWAADARRRDFTINALYCDADGTVSDPLGGYPDLAARRVRFIGEATARIREDYLRILRFFRFQAEYGDTEVDATSLAACIQEKDGLRRLSGERIRSELMKLLAAPGAAACVPSLVNSGIAAVVLGDGLHVDVFIHLTRIEAAAGLAPDPVLRLASLVLPEAGPSGLKDRIKLSSAETERLSRLARGGLELSRSIPEMAAKVAIYRSGSATFTDALHLAWARAGDSADDAGWRALTELASRWQVPVLPLRGADLLARGLPPGPRVGQILTAFEEWWLAENFVDDPARIEAKLNALLYGTGV